VTPRQGLGLRVQTKEAERRISHAKGNCPVVDFSFVPINNMGARQNYGSGMEGGGQVGFHSEKY
jgi:hypothetical protein